jgi:hypothetical protein
LTKIIGVSRIGTAHTNLENWGGLREFLKEYIYRDGKTRLS